MAFAGTTAPDRQRSPVGLTLNLSSNNPYNRFGGGASPSPRNSPFNNPWADAAPPARPTSTNPFLDDSEMSTSAPSNNRHAANMASSTRPNNNNTSNIPDDIFGELSLLDKPITNGASVQPTPSNRGPPPGYRPHDPKAPRGPPPPRPARGPNSPVKREGAPPQLRRRASESSVMEKERRPRMDRERGERPERTESEERRRRERRREREERHKKEKEKVRSGEKRTKKPHGLDIIDKLDVTGIYGQGLFHHDGPFDACNPHRNAKKDRRAPMQAFPEGSANMALGGAGPLNSRLDLDKFHGRGVEGFNDFSTTRKVDNTIIDPKQSVEPVHGDESYGLGTSTFLEGAPASRAALQRRESEDPAAEGGAGGGGGLSRKKSIAQRFRGMSNSRRNPPGMQSPEARYGNGPQSSQPQIKAISAGGPQRMRYNKENEVNPFENDYEAAFEKKGTEIRIAEQERPSAGRPRAPSSPKAYGLTRSRTSEGNPTQRSSNEEEPRTNGGSGSGGGFLSRMRSLKGGPRRARNEA